MKRTLKLAVMLAVVSAFAVGCNKEEESPHSTMETPSAKVDETGGFHLGRKLDNPYSVAKYGHNDIITQCFSEYGF